MTDTPTPAPSGGTMPNYSEVARRFWGALTAGRDYATWPCWDDMDDDAHADIEFAVSRTFDAFTAFTPPASAPGSGEVDALTMAFRFLNGIAPKLDRHEFDEGQRRLARVDVDHAAALSRARAEGEAKGRREALEECAGALHRYAARARDLELTMGIPPAPTADWLADNLPRLIDNPHSTIRIALATEGGKT